MSRDSNGNYTLPAGNPVISGTVIESIWANTTMQDLATAMTNSLSRTGAGGMQAQLKLIDGTVGVPAFAFGNEVGTGFYRAGASDIQFAMTAYPNVIRMFQGKLQIRNAANTAWTEVMPQGGSVYGSASWWGNQTTDIGVGLYESGGSAYVAGYNKALSVPKPLALIGSEVILQSSAGSAIMAAIGGDAVISSDQDIQINSTGVAGAVLITAPNGLNVDTQVASTRGWFGNTTTDIGVNLWEVFNLGVITAGPKGSNTAANGILMQGLGLTLQGTTGAVGISTDVGITLTAGTNIVLDAENQVQIKSIGRTFNAIQLTSTQTLLKYNTAAESNALNVGATGGAIYLQSPANQTAIGWSNAGVSIYGPGGTVGFETNSGSNKINYLNTNTLGLQFTAGAFFLNALDGTTVLYVDNTIIKLVNSNGQDRLSVTTFLAFPNIPAASPGASGVWRDTNGFLKI